MGHGVPAAGSAAILSLVAGLAVAGVDVKVTVDNNNVDGGTPNPSFDTQNRQANETTVAISPANNSIVAAGANDYRMVPVIGDGWLGFYVSADGGATWFNTMVPGFGSDTSPAGLASPLLGLDGSGDPVVRFDADGNLYVAGIAFNRDFDQEDRPVDAVVYVARYDYTPGTPGGTSTPNSAANPPNFTYAGTTVVDRGAVGFAVPGQPFGFAGEFVDKEWMEIDGNSPSASRCAGNVYVTHTAFHGVAGNSPIRFSRSTDGGRSFSRALALSTGGRDGTVYNQGSDIAVGPDGSVYVVYRSFVQDGDPSAVRLVKSTDCGKHWSNPILVGTISGAPAVGVPFRTPTFAFAAVDDVDPNDVYVAYQDIDPVNLDMDIFVQRSTDGGFTWEATPNRVNDDLTNKHQIFPTMEVSHGTIHLAWYDFRNSTDAADAFTNDALDVFYSCTNCPGYAYPDFAPSVRLSDVSHPPGCLMFGSGFAAFHGDYIELDAAWQSGSHTVHVAWADNRDVSPCNLPPDTGLPTNNTGNRNQNIYADSIVIIDP